MSFEKHWERRHSIEPEIKEPGKYERRKFYTFLVPVEADVRDRLSEVQEELSGFECFNPVPEHWFHVTVKLAGFLVEEPTEKDEIGAEELEKAKSKARRIAERFEPFSVEVKNLNVFPSAVFAEAHSQELGELNQKFRSIEELMPPEHEYLPHVTLAHFQDREDFEPMVEALEKFRGETFGRIEVNKVQLVKDNVQQSREKGFERVESFPL